METNFELSSVKLTGRTKKLCAELRDYAARTAELRREPVFRVRIPDFIAIRAFASKHIRPGDTLGAIKLDGREVSRYDGD
jgi:hypothetical protein